MTIKFITFKSSDYFEEWQKSLIDQVEILSMSPVLIKTQKIKMPNTENKTHDHNYGVFVIYRNTI